MKIVLSEIKEEGLDLEFEEEIETEGLKLLSPVRVKLRIDKVGSEILAKGRALAGLELQCGRCLRSFSRDMDVDIDVVYHPVEELRDEEKYEVREDELDMGFYVGDELDVGELVTEQVLLNVPMKPLCSGSCRGICPKCGADLNIKACGCERREMDPRLEILKKLFEERKE